MTKEIPLPKGKVAIVDDDDYEWLSKFKWRVNSSGYAKRDYKREGKNKELLMHREILIHHNLMPEGKITDHRNRRKLDNRKENIWACTYKENSQNAFYPKRNLIPKAPYVAKHPYRLRRIANESLLEWERSQKYKLTFEQKLAFEIAAVARDHADSAFEHRKHEYYGNPTVYRQINYQRQRLAADITRAVLEPAPLTLVAPTPARAQSAAA